MSIHKANAQIDQYRALLRTCLEELENVTPGKLDRMIAELEADFHREQDMGQKLLLHAALVGITTTMQLTIEGAGA